MTILFIDGFDHYGTTIANMTDGAWAENGSGVALATSNPRTGTAALSRGSGNNTTQQRRVFGGAKTTVGVGAAWYLSSLPSIDDRAIFYQFKDTSNAAQLTLVLQTTGILDVKRGENSGTTIGTSTVPVVVAEAYTHIEMLATFDNTSGSFEVRVNGVTVISETNIDTVNTSNVEASQITFFSDGIGINTDITINMTMDDLFCYDDSGSFNNTFIGDRKVFTLFPDADTAQDDWIRDNGSTDFGRINEADPDDDSTYLYANPGASPPFVSEFDLDNLPSDVSSIAAVYTVNRLRKTDAGTADVTSSIVSASSESDGDSHALTTAYTYYQDVFEADPDTSAPFTPEAVNALKIKIERTA